MKKVIIIAELKGGTKIAGYPATHMGNFRNHAERIDFKGKVVESSTAPTGVIEGRLWLDTSDNTFQGTVFDSVLGNETLRTSAKTIRGAINELFTSFSSGMRMMSLAIAEQEGPGEIQMMRVAVMSATSTDPTTMPEEASTNLSSSFSDLVERIRRLNMISQSRVEDFELLDSFQKGEVAKKTASLATLSRPRTIMLPTSWAADISFSSNHQYMALAMPHAPYLCICKKQGDRLTILPSPTFLPTAEGKSVALSPNAEYLAVGYSSNTSGLLLYKRNGDQFIKLANTSVLPLGNIDSLAFSEDGTKLIVGHDNAPFLSIYQQRGDEFYKLPNSNVLPTKTPKAISLSRDGEYLAIPEAPYLYRWDGTTYNQATTLYLPSLPASAESVSISSDGLYLALGYTVAPYLAIFKRHANGTYEFLPQPVVLPTGPVAAVRFAPNTNYLVVTHSSAPILSVYKRNGDSFTKTVNPAVLPNGIIRSMCVSSDGLHIAIGAENQPGILLYEGVSQLEKLHGLGDANALAVLKEDGTVGDMRQATVIWG